MVEKSKVELKPMVKDALQNLVIQDIRAAKEPIPLPLIRLAEKCIPIYLRNESIYLKNNIDYSDSGFKKMVDVENAIKKLRELEVEKVQYTPQKSETVSGQVTVWHYPPVDGDAVILLSIFTDDILSLTEIPKYEIKIMLEEGILGLKEEE